MSNISDCRVVIVIGDSCVGKTFVARGIQRELNLHGEHFFRFIETSDVVKELSSNPFKDGLDLLLNDDLMILLVERIKRAENVILSGLREKKIHDTLRKLCNNVYTIRITAPDNVVKQRVKKRHGVTPEKLKRDALYDYYRIPIDCEIGNIKETDYTKVFWYDKFREVVGLDNGLNSSFCR